MATSPIPDGLTEVTPSMVVSPCAAAIDWYVRVFGAEEIEPRMTGPDGMVGHAEVRFGSAVVMLADPWPDGPTQAPTEIGGTTVGLFLYRADAREIWDRAIEAGAEVVFPFEKQFYGDEGGRIRDPFGHSWGIGRHVEDVSPEEMERRMATFYEELDQQG
ncbi:MAG: VOC family protein [Acidimicrobiales bacterium]|nr:VOC family protein [Acidimicrobiales bacterium]